MQHFLTPLIAISFTALLQAQTADELVARNIEAHGGIVKIKAIKTLRMTGAIQIGRIQAQVTEDAMAPDKLKQAFTLMGMSQIRSYDGASGWQISPFEGRKDPELLGEQAVRGLSEEADFYGPLVDYQAKGNKIEYLGHDTVDGDDAYRLKVTLKNGDIVYYFLDPDTSLEIRRENVQFIQGAVQESFTELGSYKQVAGVYFPFSLESGSKRNPGETAKIAIDKIEANVPMEAAAFKMPEAPKATKPVAPAAPHGGAL